MSFVFVIGPFPPPIHGMAKNLKLFANEIDVVSKMKTVDISPGTIQRGVKYHVTKLLKVILGLFKLFLYSLKGEVKSVYIPPDAGFGAYYTLLFILITRIFSLPTYMHHRSFLYINKKTKAMNLITRVQPKLSTHVFLCKKMKDNFEKLYGAMDSMIVSNAQYVNPIKSPKQVGKELVLGHLSNLGFEKGIKQVFDLCDSLNANGVKFFLHLAGPPENNDVEIYLQRQLKKFSGQVKYYGQVNNEEKHHFYSCIDVFLFPTKYRNEAQPNVLFEAMSYGCPVLTVNTGCISADVSCSSGFVFVDQLDFSLQAPEVVKRLVDNSTYLEGLKNSTLIDITSASAAAKQNYTKLVNKVAEGK